MQVSLGIALAIIAAVVGFVVGGFVVPRLNARRELRLAEQQGPSRLEVLREVYHQAPYALAVVDRYQDVVLYNRRAAELGIVDDRLLVDPVWRAASATFTDGDPSAFDLPAKIITGRRRIPSVSGRSEILGGHHEQFVVVFADDDSEQRRMEAARRDFVANVSHELKTPVGAMAVLAEALLESKDDPESVEYFGGRVVSEAHRLGKMVSELIELSRLQGAERIRDAEPVDVDAVVDEAMRRSASAAEAAGIELITDSPSGLEISGDWTLLVTALTNLISNAVNYSPERTPVSITRAIDGDTVMLRVTDRGIGIAPEHQTRVFERFFRVDKARSRATGGTGLGLAIVKHVAQNHNGLVTIWSRPGTGSTFTLELPAHVEPGGEGAPPPSEHDQQGEDQVP
ncbi:sensor histidine kinase [Dietzia psychralcaliphila]|uniref:Sensor-like histidine kinase SenX3 n=1 Tax=Dietzia psychralcaliphila TaxID=139021 RepID=A0AAD0JVY7_9ACTN|nr:ATP-binding protein [Dietzia psychralcaliphila]AWH96466.1 two-component sensor histidine kinase [Dietzia psychralcaliphila]PTM90384.1 two-component system sensor histidine kinase SenX3 [Dietzia psychralcaliphila]